ncbi:hypothetical protein N7540_011896 [Penicillium herquei]|nr:hypothetical protein N7540_011896 [Penicillium herquei]
MKIWECLRTITLALPYGMLADWIGYRPAAVLAFFGTAMCANWSRVVFWFYPILPIRALWFSALWRILGGGPQIVTSLTFSAVASVTPAKKRTTVFSQMTAVILTTELIGPPIGAMLMAKILGYPSSHHLQSLQSQSSGPLHLASSSLFITDIFGELWRDRDFALVVACLFVSLLGTQTFGLLLQYVTKRFHISYAEASYAYSLRASFSLISLFILLPVATNLLDRKYAWNITRRDKILTQVNLLFMLLGCLLIFVAPNLICLSFGVVMFGLGTSFSVTARTLLTSLVDQASLSTAYTFLSIMSSNGSLVSGPMLAAVYHMGMVLGDIWLGLPFLFAAALYGLSLLAVSAIKIIPRTA